MPAPRPIITIPKPCSESWEGMAAVDKGRFCASCQKAVVDYSILTDDEIIARLKALKSEPSCGRFHKSQLGRELVATRHRSNFPAVLLSRMAASLLFFQTIATTAWAQKVKPSTTQHAKKATIKKHASNRAIIGNVIDYATNEKLHSMSVQIKGTEIKAITDKSGAFRLALPDSFKVTKFTLCASYTAQSGKEAAGTIIMSEDVNMDSLPTGTKVVLYRYPKEELMPEDVISIREFPQDIIMGGSIPLPLSTLIEENVKKGEDIKKKNFWQRLSAPFRKKDMHEQ
jgi:hypothetical protein